MTREEREAYFHAARHEADHAKPTAHNRQPQQTSMRMLRSRRIRRFWNRVDAHRAEDTTFSPYYWDARDHAYQFRNQPNLAAVPCDEHSRLLVTNGDAPCPSTALADAFFVAGLNAGITGAVTAAAA